MKGNHYLIRGGKGGKLELCHAHGASSTQSTYIEVAHTKHKEKMSRRDFVRAATIGGVASVLPLRFSSFSQLLTAQDKSPTVEYRQLGRTGLNVSVVGFGAMRTFDENVIHHALDLGINYIDTADCYMFGNNERFVGNVLQSRRYQTYVATKVHISTESKMMKSVTRSLKRLKTGVIDVIQLHDLTSSREVLHQGAMNALKKMRDMGMARFVGFSTHENQVECIQAAVESRFYDMILVAYNFRADPRIGEAIHLAANAGIGIVAMKTQAGGYTGKGYPNWSTHQAALRWILEKTSVATTIPSMVSFAHVDDNIQVMGTRLGIRDRKALNRYGQIYDREICRMCGGCTGQCPWSVPIQSINRTLMYAEGYEDHGLALRTYRQLASESPVDACDRCDTCQVVCRNGLDIPARLARARKIFA